MDRSMRQQLCAIIRRRLAEDFFENAVEVREGLETNFKRDLADAKIRIEQEILGFFNPHPRDVVGEIDAGDFLEHFAKIIAAHVHCLGDLAQRYFLGLMIVNVSARFADDGRLGIFLLDEHLIAQHGKVLCKNAKQLDGGIMLLLVDDFAGEISFSQRLGIQIQLPLLAQF